MPDNVRVGWAAKIHHRSIIFCSGPIAAFDASLALLIQPLQPGNLTLAVSRPSLQPSAAFHTRILPSSLGPSFTKLLNPDPKVSIMPNALLDVGMAESLGESGGFFRCW